MNCLIHQFLSQAVLPHGFKIHPEWSNDKWTALSMCSHLAFHTRLQWPLEWGVISCSLCPNKNGHFCSQRLNTLLFLFTCGRQQSTKPCLVDPKNNEDKSRGRTFWENQNNTYYPRFFKTFVEYLYALFKTLRCPEPAYALCDTTGVEKKRNKVWLQLSFQVF